jgi:hypothetical protein
MANPGADDGELMADAGHGQAQLVAELGQRVTADVAQFTPLEILPEPLVRVQLGRVGGQGLQMQALGRALREEVLDHLRAVDRGAVPDDEQLARNMAQQVLKETHHVRPAQSVVFHLHEDLPRRGDRANSRQVIPRERHPQHRRLAPGRISADGGRQEIEARLIYPHERAVFGPSFFSRAGICSAVQAAIVASLRWVARRSGF